MLAVTVDDLAAARRWWAQADAAVRNADLAGWIGDGCAWHGSVDTLRWTLDLGDAAAPDGCERRRAGRLWRACALMTVRGHVSSLRRLVGLEQDVLADAVRVASVELDGRHKTWWQRQVPHVDPRAATLAGFEAATLDLWTEAAHEVARGWPALWPAHAAGLHRETAARRYR